MLNSPTFSRAAYTQGGFLDVGEIETALAPFPLRFHVGTKDGVNAGLIALSLCFQPLQNIVIQPDRYPVLGSGNNDLGMLRPVRINTECCHILRSLLCYLFLGH